MKGQNFNLGQTVFTSSVDRLAHSSNDFMTFVLWALTHYCKCDWGDTCKEDAAMNDVAVKSGNERIFASYNFPENAPWKDEAFSYFGSKEDKIWIITEWDRSATTILFPSEY